MVGKERIVQCIVAHDWVGVENVLKSLSNMEFRRMECVLREDVLATLENGLFWEALLHLIIIKRAAFLSWVVAVEHLAKDGTLSFEDENVGRLYGFLKENHEESIVKVCNMMMPVLMTEEQVEQMFKAFHVESGVTRLSILLKVDSPLSYYLIFKTLKWVEDKVITRKCCMAIVKRCSDMAFNAVCLFKAYFGLDDLPARFSMNVEPYELSHIDRNYEVFLNVLNGKRPTI